MVQISRIELAELELLIALDFDASLAVLCTIVARVAEDFFRMAAVLMASDFLLLASILPTRMAQLLLVRLATILTSIDQLAKHFMAPSPFLAFVRR